VGGAHGGEGPRARPLVAGALGGGHDPAVGDHNHVLATELLLQLAHQALLDLVERLLQPVRHLHTCREHASGWGVGGDGVAAACLQLLNRGVRLLQRL